MTKDTKLRTSIYEFSTSESASSPINNAQLTLLAGSGKVPGPTMHCEKIVRTKSMPITVAFELYTTMVTTSMLTLPSYLILVHSAHLSFFKLVLLRKFIEGCFVDGSILISCRAGIEFGATHSEGIFVMGQSPHILAPRVKAIRAKAAEVGRDPQSIKVFATVTPIIGKTREEAQAKYEEALKYASIEGGLTFWSGGSGIDLSQFDLDTEIQESDAKSDHRVQSLVANLAYKGDDIPKWTPRNIGKTISLGASGPLPVGTAEDVADELERWMDIADLDGFNVGYVSSLGSFEDVVNLLIPELRKRSRYPTKVQSGTMRERIYGEGQSRLRDDHEGSKYKYEVYRDE